MRATWAARDLPVLDATVALLEETPGSIPEVVDIACRTGMDITDVHQALAAMDGIYVDYRVGLDIARGYVRVVTADARRAVGQWPTAEDLLSQIVEGLNSAAEREPDPEHRSRLDQAAGMLGGAARDIAVGVLQRVVERTFGLG